MDNFNSPPFDYLDLPAEPELPEPEPFVPKICTLTLADGTKLENLRLNGTNFVSEEKIDESIFPGNLSTLTISDGETETVLHNAELIQQVKYSDGWYSCFREKTAAELREAILESAIYVSRLAVAGEKVDTDEKRIRASGLYFDWEPGNHAVGEVYNAAGQTWECFQAYDNEVYPDIRPGQPAWYTFNRPLHGTSAETARPFVPVQGAHDMYHAGEYITWHGSIYRCKEDTNFSPEDYPQAWERQDPPG